jgi:hypothetical protein
VGLSAEIGLSKPERRENVEAVRSRKTGTTEARDRYTWNSAPEKDLEFYERTLGARA